MQSILRYALEHRVVVYFAVFLLALCGIISFFFLGQLEDPNFTVKTAQVVTLYPGASPKEVELEITDRLEKAIQRMPQLDRVTSLSRPGESIITVEIKANYWSEKLPQVWDELRRKVQDVEDLLPPGSSKPRIIDDFGDVYGFLLAITADGYSYKELEEYAEAIQKELSLVFGVARVALWGVQQKVIYLDVTSQQLQQLNITPETFLHTLKQQNSVVDAGSADIGYADSDAMRLRIAPSGEFKDPEQIGQLLITAQTMDVLGNALIEHEAKGGQQQPLRVPNGVDSVLFLKDIAKIRPGYLDPPSTLMRYNGKPAIAIQIAGQPDANIVEVGQRLYERLDQIVEQLPVGLQVHKIAWQSNLVSEAVNGFIISFIESLLIVLLVLVLPSGLRMGIVIGSSLILTILATFIFMAVTKTPLQRMSLGALIIAMGMMVDNAIVIADGIAVKLREGVEAAKAALEVVRQQAYPLFAATLIAVLAFYPIYASEESAGEYCITLFTVIAASLLISWFLAMVFTPLQTIDLLPSNSSRSLEEGNRQAEFNSSFYRFYRSLLQTLIDIRFVTASLLMAALLLSIFGFGYVRQLFFPDSARPQLMIDYWAPYGTPIQAVSEALKRAEKEILQHKEVESVTSFIGAGPPRFYLPVDPEKPYSNYAQLIVNFYSFQQVNPFAEAIESWFLENAPEAMVRVRQYGVGPSDTWKFDLKVTGPAEADLETLRQLAVHIREMASQSPLGKEWRFDTQNPVLNVVPEYDQKRGRWAGVARPDLAHTLKRGYDGVEVGLYREGRDLYPIILRNSEEERRRFFNQMPLLPIKADGTTVSVPSQQTIIGVKTEWEQPLIARWNRRRAIAIQGSPIAGATFPMLYKDVIDRIEKVELPPGYSLVWDGEKDSTEKSQRSLIPGLVPAFIAIVFLLVTVFNAFKPVLITLLTLPFAMIGITAGLLFFDIPFGFVALLGAMSLAGMMNKNIVVLLSACDEYRSEGMSPYQAIIEASVTRMRPVLLAAATTILGVIPLLPDVFWQGLAVAIMAGLSFGSLLTLVAVPVFHSIFYRSKPPKHIT